MDINGVIALVSGANRGLGRAIATALVERGADRVFGGARDPDQVTDSAVTPIRLDITDPSLVAAAAEQCSGVALLVNNAGIAALSRFLESSTDSAQALMDTNYLGTLRMCQAFAPVLARNGGGALVNILSIVSFMSAPGMGPFSATKAALWSLTNGLRMELRSEGTHVLGVHPSFIDTHLTAQLEVPKLDPRDVANWILDAIEDGREELLVGERTRACKNALPNDLELLYPELERKAGTASRVSEGHQASAVVALHQYPRSQED